MSTLPRLNSIILRSRRALTAAVAVLALAVVVAPAAEAKVGGPIIAPGSQGRGVFCVETALNVVGGAGLAPNNQWDVKTTTALKNFQRFFGMPQNARYDGRVGDLVNYILYQRGYWYPWIQECYWLTPGA